MLLKFDKFNEALGINDSVVLAAQKIFDIINSSDKTLYTIPDIKLGNHTVEVEIFIKDMKDTDGSFNATKSSNEKIFIKLSSKNSYSSLVHELKHAHRFLMMPLDNRDSIIFHSIKQFSKDSDEMLSIIEHIFYFLNMDEFEAQYHSIYMNLSKNKKLSKKDIDDNHHIRIYNVILEFINRDDFMDLMFDNEVKKTKFLLMLHRYELYQRGRNYLYKNVRKSGSFGLSDFKFMFRIKKFLLDKNIIKLSDKEKVELNKLEKEIKKILIKNSKVIKKKLSRLYSLVNHDESLNEEIKIKNVDFGITIEELGDILTYITDEFPELSWQIDTSSQSGIIRYDMESFIIDMYIDGDSQALYYLEPKIFELISQVNAQLKHYGLEVFFSDFGQNDAIYELVITKIRNKPTVWQDRYIIDNNGKGYAPKMSRYPRTTTDSEFKFKK